MNSHQSKRMCCEDGPNAQFGEEQGCDPSKGQDPRAPPLPSAAKAFTSDTPTMPFLQGLSAAKATRFTSALRERP